MNERQVQRRERQIIPAWSKRGREYQHASFARACFDERGTAILKTRQHRCVRAWLGTEVANHVCGGEPAALLKHFENRVIEFHFRNGNALSRLRLHCFTQRGRRDLLKRVVETV